MEYSSSTGVFKYAASLSTRDALIIYTGRVLNMEVNVCQDSYATLDLGT